MTRGRLTAVVAAALLVAGTPAVWKWRRPSPAPPVSRERPPAVEASIALPANLTLTIGRGASIAFTPASDRVVFAAAEDGLTRLYAKTDDGQDVRAIAGTDGASNPFFSPDGRWLAFFADGKLKKVPAQGGAPITIADAPAPRGHAWTATDDIILTPRDNTSLWRVHANGGRLEPFTTLADGDVSHRWAHALPDGKGILFTVWSGTWEAAQLVVQPLDGGPRRVILKGAGYGHYVADGDRAFIVYAQPDVMAIPFNLERLEISGPPVGVAEGVITNFSGAAQFAVSANELAYIAAPRDADIERDVVWVGRDGGVTPAAKLRGLGRWFDLSPDGTAITRYREEPEANDVWIENLVSATSTRVAARNDPARYRNSDRLNAIWTRDGRDIVYASGQPPNLFRAAASGGDGERLTTSANLQWPGSFSPDGRQLAYVEVDPLSGSDIWILPLDAQGRPGPAQPFLRTPFNESAPMISPDGRWLAYQSNESGRYEIYVQPFPAGGPRVQVSTEEGVYPRWSPKGGELFYRGGAAREGLAAVAVDAGPGFRIAAQRVLFDARGYNSIFAPSPDASRFLMIPIRARDNAVKRIQLVSNWLSGLTLR